MKIDKNHKEKIIDEFKLVAKAMKEENNIERKIYFYSGAHGIVNRILNIDYDPELLFIDYILERSYETINSGITAFIRGERRAPIPNPSVILEKIADEVNKLANSIEKGESYIKILNRIVELSYLTTGNGAYLHYKGVIKI
jgi:hypothetical protein